MVDLGCLIVIGVIVWCVASEGLWGAALGKLLCGLRVVGAGRGAPGIAVAALRALLVMCAINLADFIELLIHSAEQVKQAIEHDGWTFTDAVGPSFLVLLFVEIAWRVAPPNIVLTNARRQ